MRSNDATAFGNKIGDGSGQARFGRIAVYVENKDLAGVQSRRPQVFAVIGEARVVGFVAATHRHRVDDLSIAG